MGRGMMSAMFCQMCGLEMVKEQRVLGDPALDCGGDCAGCISEVEQQVLERPPAPKVISRREYPDIYDVLAEVYGSTTTPLPDMPNRLDATDLLPLTQTADGTPI
jgi:hypothetical protein